MNREQFIINILHQKNYKVGAEIGVAKGVFSRHILNYWPGTLYMIDVWRKLADEEYLDGTNLDIEENAWLETMLNIRGLEERALMMRMYSHQAAALIQDGSLDFVYIDANHKYDAVVDDIKLWWPKVRSGGMMAGHDFLHNLDWTTSSEPNNKDKHVYIGKDSIPYCLDTKEDTPEYAGLFGVFPAVREFAEQNSCEVFHTTEHFSSWITFK